MACRRPASDGNKLAMLMMTDPGGLDSQRLPLERRVARWRARGLGSGVIGSALQLGLGDPADTVGLYGLRGAGLGLNPGWGLGFRAGVIVAGMVGLAEVYVWLPPHQHAL